MRRRRPSGLATSPRRRRRPRTELCSSPTQVLSLKTQPIVRSSTGDIPSLSTMTWRLYQVSTIQALRPGRPPATIPSAPQVVSSLLLVQHTRLSPVRASVAQGGVPSMMYLTRRRADGHCKARRHRPSSPWIYTTHLPRPKSDGLDKDNQWQVQSVLRIPVFFLKRPSPPTNPPPRVSRLARRVSCAVRVLWPTRGSRPIPTRCQMPIAPSSTSSALRSLSSRRQRSRLRGRLPAGTRPSLRTSLGTLPSNFRLHHLLPTHPHRPQLCPLILQLLPRNMSTLLPVVSRSLRKPRELNVPRRRREEGVPRYTHIDLWR